MKKLFSLMALIALSVTAWAETFESGNYLYQILTAPYASVKGTARCIGLSEFGKNNPSFDLIIPYIAMNGTKSYRVTSVGQEAFKGCTNFSTVRLFYGVDTIYSGAFQNCTNITYARIPSSVRMIQSDVFRGCSKLTKIYCAALSPMSNGSYAFYTGATTTLYVPWGADLDAYRSSIGTTYHKRSSDAWDFHLTGGNQVIVTKAPEAGSYGQFTIIGFSSDQTLASTDAKNGILKCNSPSVRAGDENKWFTYVAVSDSAFYGNTALKELDLSGLTALTSFGTAAARGCINLTSVNLGGGAVGSYAFAGCTSLSSLTLNGVTQIGNSAFRNCSSLTSIKIPSTTYSIQTSSFVTGCTALTEINVDTENTFYTSYNCALYNKSKTVLYRIPEAWANTALNPPATLSSIYSSAAYYCTTLKAVFLPFGVKLIHSQAFMGCSSLNMVYIPSSTTYIGARVFSGCSSLKLLSVNTRYAPLNADTNVLGGLTTSSVHLRVQRDMVSAFKSAGWTGFASYNNDDVVATDYRSGYLGYTITSTAAESSYAGRARVVRHSSAGDVSGTVRVPASITINGNVYAVTAIDTLAFNTTRSFRLTGCDNIDTIAYRAFYNQPITSIDLPSIKYFGEESFYGSGITSVDLPDHHVKFGIQAFCNATSLTEIVIRSGLGWSSKFYGNNADNFNLYILNNLVYAFTNSMSMYDFNDTYKCSERIAPCFTATATTMPLAVQANLQFSTSNLPSKPHYVTSYDAATNTAKTSSSGLVYGIAGSAVMLTDLKVGDFYKIPRRYANSVTTNSSIMVPNASSASKNISTVDNAYYWDTDNLRFVKAANSGYKVPAGQAYLVAEGGGNYIYLDMFPKTDDDVTGDLNGDGIVDITDVNMAINMVLGKTDKTSAADVDGSGDVDITDVNLVINIALGK